MTTVQNSARPTFAFAFTPHFVMYYCGLQKPLCEVQGADFSLNSRVHVKVQHTIVSSASPHSSCADENSNDYNRLRLIKDYNPAWATYKRSLYVCPSNQPPRQKLKEFFDEKFA